MPAELKWSGAPLKMVGRRPWVEKAKQTAGLKFIVSDSEIRYGYVLISGKCH